MWLTVSAEIARAFNTRCVDVWVLAVAKRSAEASCSP